MCPLPNAEKRSPRVYTLSQNQTLETFATGDNPTVMDIGKPLSVEALNEDELRRLVLLKFAVTACKGDWVGFLS
tara:strand:- start:206 stop:427 length:222 start_codon:yes stop_codon:yes gene_type:complete